MAIGQPTLRHSLKADHCATPPIRRWAMLAFYLLITVLAVDLITSLAKRQPPFTTSFELIAEGLANSIGFIELRPGYLANKSAKLKGLEATLQPLDILVISAPFKGTSFFTPGRNTHLAVWMGSNNEWLAINRINDPRVQTLQRQIAQGNRLLQADRDGVALSPLSSITSADEISIYRATPPLNTATYLQRIIDNLGKAYDYNLDGLDNTKLICTELIYSIFPQIPVEMTNRLGRTFIIPDAFKRGLDKSETWRNIFYAGPEDRASGSNKNESALKITRTPA